MAQESQETTVLCLDEDVKLSSKKVYVKLPKPLTSFISPNEGSLSADIVAGDQQCWVVSDTATSSHFLHNSSYSYQEPSSLSTDQERGNEFSGDTLIVNLPGKIQEQNEDAHLIYVSKEQLRKEQVYVVRESNASVAQESIISNSTSLNGTSNAISRNIHSDERRALPYVTNSPTIKKKATNFRLFKCDFCNKTFSSNYSLICHMRIHTKETPYHCPIHGCCKKFKISGDLAKHIRSHTGERPFVCEVCGRSFTTCNILKVHSRTHTGERPYACTEPNCGKIFSSDTNLRNHMRIHRGEKPYVCPIQECGKRFTEYSSLFKHKAVHENIKKFGCQWCSREYRQISTLRHHLRRAHHGESCNDCGTCDVCVNSSTAPPSPAAVHTIPDNAPMVLHTQQHWPGEAVEATGDVGVEELLTTKAGDNQPQAVVLLTTHDILTQHQVLD